MLAKSDNTASAKVCVFLNYFLAMHLLLGSVSGAKEQLRSLMPCMEQGRNHPLKRRISSKLIPHC